MLFHLCNFSIFSYLCSRHKKTTVNYEKWLVYDTNINNLNKIIEKNSRIGKRKMSRLKYYKLFELLFLLNIIISKDWRDIHMKRDEINFLRQLAIGFITIKL